MSVDVKCRDIGNASHIVWTQGDQVITQGSHTNVYLQYLDFNMTHSNEYVEHADPTASANLLAEVTIPHQMC